MQHFKGLSRTFLIKRKFQYGLLDLSLNLLHFENVE